MSETTSAAPPAGWYGDYLSTSLVRWWDGSRWTDHTMPVPTPESRAPVAVGMAAAPATGPSWGPAAEPQAPASRSRRDAQTPAVAPDGAFEQPSRMSEYRPMQSSFVPRVMQFGSPNTGWIWVIAFSIVINIALQIAAVAPGIFPSQTGLVMALGVFVGLMAIAGVRDRAVLRQRNLPGASPWWLLLSPIAFLIVRWVVLRQIGVNAHGPGIVYGLNVVLTVGLGVLAAILIPVFLLQQR